MKLKKKVTEEKNVEKIVVLKQTKKVNAFGIIICMKKTYKRFKITINCLFNYFAKCCHPEHSEAIIDKHDCRWQSYRIICVNEAEGSSHQNLLQPERNA